MKVTTENITEAAASLNAQAEKLDEISSQITRIESQLRQSSTNLDSQIQFIERQRKNVEQHRLTLNQLIRAANSAVEQYQKCEQDAVADSDSGDTTEGLVIEKLLDTHIQIVGPGGQAPSISDINRVIHPTLIWPLNALLIQPIRQIWVGPTHKPRIPVIPIPEVKPAKTIRPAKPVSPRKIHLIDQILIRPMLLK